MARGAWPWPSAAILKGRQRAIGGREAVAMRKVLPRDDERSVSDVLGAILLVGITVVMAAAFGAVLLAYDGPSDQQHTQLGVVVGPGADGDWGPNDAELKITHLGGEPLLQAGVRIIYVDTAGTQTVSPTFTGGVLKVGQAWTHTISATPGATVAVTVVATVSGGSAVISSGSVAAGGTGATLTYVSGITPAPGKGSVADLANAQSAIDLNAAATLTEGAAGGTPSSSTRSPGSNTNSGATSPGNIVSSNDARAVLDNSAEWVQGAGYSAPGGAMLVSALSIGMEARAVQPVSTVTHVATVTGGATSGSTVATVSILGSAGDVYLAAVANGVSNLRTVTGVSGPPGISWTQVGTQTNSAGNGHLELWVGTGTPSIAGVVTATFSGNIDRAGIAVSRYSGVDTASPIQASLAGEAAGSGGTAVSLGTVAGTATSGVFYAALNGVTAAGGAGCTFTTPANERADFDPGNNRVQLCAAGGTAAASNTLAATISSSADWQAILVTLRPYAPPLPTAVLSYRLSGVAGATSLTQGLGTTEAQYTQSILADRAWTVADIANLDVRVTYPTDTGADVEVDHIYLTMTVTTTPTTYSTQADLAFTGVPSTPTEVFQMRYKVAGDTFLVYAMTGAIERQCAGTLNSATFAVFTCSLTAAEFNGGAPVVRIKDVTPGGTGQGSVTIDYARISSS